MKSFRTLFLVSLATILLSGCIFSGSGSNTHWYNPTTWFSGSEGRSVASLTEKVDDSKTKLRKGAQKTAHETQEALKAAPQDNRAVQVATEANDRTVANLDQTEGVLITTEADALKNQVKLLLSDVAYERAQGEKLRDREREADRKNSEALAKRDAALAAANANLLSGFERENALANTLRNYQFGVIGLIVLLLIGTAAYIYLRVVAGGIPQALGNVLTRFRVSHPDQASHLTDLLDDVLSKKQQAAIAAHTA